MLNDLTSKLSTLSHRVNVQRSCNFVFRHSNKKVSTATGARRLDQVNLPTFIHFFAEKQTQITFQLFHSRSPCLGNHKYYFRYGLLFCKYIRKLYSDDHQFNDAFDNPMCALISRINYVQRNEPRSSRHGPGWIFALLRFGHVLYFRKFLTWNMYVITYETKYCFFL